MLLQISVVIYLFGGGVWLVGGGGFLVWWVVAGLIYLSFVVEVCVAVFEVGFCAWPLK